MREINLSELERLQASISEADETLQMDQETFCAAIREDCPPAMGLLFANRGRTAADDLLQETYYRFLRTRGAIESEKHRKNYLFRIANEPGAMTTGAADAALDAIVGRDMPSIRAVPRLVIARRDLERALGKLEARQRDALWMAYAGVHRTRRLRLFSALRSRPSKQRCFRARRKARRPFLLGGAR
jgi:DNA-directed RNA polymerase specialized sigma24 family protein